MLPRVTRRRMSLLCAVMLVALGALDGCRQAPLDPAFRIPSPDETPPLAPARVDVTVPSGFVEAYDYHIVNPLHPAPVVQFLVPADAGPDNAEVIGVASYVMDVDVTASSDSQLVSRVMEYAAHLRAEATEPVKTTVAGLPAFTTAMREPAEGGGVFTYDATFIFTGRRMVSTSCQYDQEKALIERACASVLASMKIVVYS